MRNNQDLLTTPCHERHPIYLVARHAKGTALVLPAGAAAESQHTNFLRPVGCAPRTLLVECDQLVWRMADWAYSTFYCFVSRRVYTKNWSADTRTEKPLTLVEKACRNL